MRTTVSWLGALVLAGLFVSLASANPFGRLHFPWNKPCDCESKQANSTESTEKPSCHRFHLFEALSGCAHPNLPRPGLNNGNGNGYGSDNRMPQIYPTHPWVRGPRDFFMMD